jgi:hypothetical protein
MFLITTACANSVPRVTPNKKGVDPIFDIYVENYKQLIGEGYEDRFEILHMNFAELEGEVVGRCYWLLGGGYEVEIDTAFWNNTFNPRKKEFVVYHELEHCIRFRMHTNKKEQMENIVDFFEEIAYRLGIIKKPGLLEDGCPSSIMNSRVIGPMCRIMHHDYYLDEIRNYNNL